MSPPGPGDTASKQVLPLSLLLLPPMLMFVANQPCLVQGKSLPNLLIRRQPPLQPRVIIPTGSPTPRDGRNLKMKSLTASRRPSVYKMFQHGPINAKQSQLPHPSRPLAPRDVWNATTPMLGRITSSSTSSQHDEAPTTTHAQRYNYERRGSTHDVDDARSYSKSYSTDTQTTDDETLTTAAPQSGDSRLISRERTTVGPRHRPRLSYLLFPTLYPPGSRPTSLPVVHGARSGSDEHVSYFNSMVILISVACFLGGVMLSATTSYCLYQRHCLTKMSDVTTEADDIQPEGPVRRNLSLIYSFPPPNLDNPKANLLDFDFLLDVTADKDPDDHDVTSPSPDDDDDYDDDYTSSTSDPDRYSLVTRSSTASNSSRFSRESPQELSDFPLLEPT